MSDLPNKEKNSERKVIDFFDSYFTEKQTFAVNQFDACTAFFTSKKFSKEAALTLSQVLLVESRNSNVNVFDLLDTLSGYTQVQLSTLVTTILNARRDKSSKLGFKVSNFGNTIEKRNIKI